MALKVFISYAREDLIFRQELDKHLNNLKRQEIISSWHDGDIIPGTERQPQITEQLKTADIILLLVSADFMASDFCYSTVLKQAIARHDAHQAHVIPILLRPTDWEGAPFAKLDMLPTDAKAVTDWPSHDKAFEDVVQGIKRALSVAPTNRAPKAQINASIVSTTPRKLTFEQKSKLVEKLLACPTMRDRSSRDQVVGDLPFANSIRRDSKTTDKQDIMAIVNRCLDFPSDGLQQLVERVEFDEENSTPMQELRALVQSLS
jgi:Effector-associated domain 2/TIR domain